MRTPTRSPARQRLPAPVNVRTLLRPVRRLWPQKVRTRLTLLYAALFFAAGLALLGLTYGLVASSLPARPPAAATSLSSQELNFLNRECKPPGPAKKDRRPSPLPSPLAAECKQTKVAYSAAPSLARRRSARAR
jgi:hypothetical protein